MVLLRWFDCLSLSLAKALSCRRRQIPIVLFLDISKVWIVVSWYKGFPLMTGERILMFISHWPCGSSRPLAALSRIFLGHQGTWLCVRTHSDTVCRVLVVQIRIGTTLTLLAVTVQILPWTRIETTCSVVGLSSRPVVICYLLCELLSTPAGPVCPDSLLQSSLLLRGLLARSGQSFFVGY